MNLISRCPECDRVRIVDTSMDPEQRTIEGDLTIKCDTCENWLVGQ